MASTPISLLLLFTLLPSIFASSPYPFLTFHSPSHSPSHSQSLPDTLQNHRQTSSSSTLLAAQSPPQHAHITQNQNQNQHKNHAQVNKAYEQAKQLQAEAAATARARRSMESDRIDLAIRARQAAESVSAQRMQEDPLQKPKPVKKWAQRRPHAKLERHLEQVRMRRELEQQPVERSAENAMRMGSMMRRSSVENAAESCSDGVLNQDETAVDCGGVCRDQTYLFKGLRFLHACKHAQTCNVNADCLSHVCYKPDYTCAPREPLAAGTTHIEVLRRLHESFFNLVQNETSVVLRPNDIHALILATANPDAQEIPNERASKLEERILEFKRNQGLNDDVNVDVHLGYISRGEPMAFIMSLFQLREE